MALPAALLALAVAFAAALAYGTDPLWMRYAHGLDIIILARRFQWPLVAASIICSLAVVSLVVASRRRAWWLLGLAPVLALFAHRFATSPVNRLAVADSPALVAAENATFLKDTDWVVGVTLADAAFAFPYAALYRTPVVSASEGEKRMLLLFCASANSAVATTISRSLRPRELEIVCAPANSLLLYNARNGQFINAFTAQTPGAEKPAGFSSRIPVVKTTWANWRVAHPNTRVLPVTSPAGAPAVPILPNPPLAPARQSITPQTPITLILTTQPAAIPTERITHTPLNTRSGDVPFFLFRDPATGAVRAFDRRLEPDLAPRFVPNNDPKRKAAFLDLDTNTGWSIAGQAVDGDKSRVGKKLVPIDLQEDVYWGVAAFWMKDLVLQTEDAPEPAVRSNATAQPATQRTRASTRRKRPRQ